MTEYELYHASTRKHKYIKKIGNRYFYSQQEIQAYLQGKKNPVEFSKIQDFSNGDVRIGPDGKPQGGKTIGARMYYDKNKNGGYSKSIGVAANNNKVTLLTTNSDHTIDLNKPKKALDKKRKQLNDAKEAVAEATGRRDVYFEAKKVTENGRTYYDDDNAQLKTGKKDKRGKVDSDGTVYTKNGTMQYDNEYTRELNEKTRKRGRKKLKKMATSPMRSLKKQSAKGKNAISKLAK